MSKSAAVFLFLMGFCCPNFGQTVLYQESFEQIPETMFREFNSQFGQGEIKGGKYHWKYTGQNPQVITYYCNQLKINEDFTVTLRIKSQQSGSEYGLTWGGNDPQNARYFLIKGRRYSICQVVDGQVTCDVNQQPGKVKLDYNVLKVEKMGTKIQYWINEHQLYSETYSGVMGKAFGMALWSTGVVQVDEFSIFGTRVPIHLDSALAYQSGPEHLGAAINTKYEEMTPVITPNGKELYFSRRRDPANTGGAGDLQDVYYSKLGVDGWSQSVNLKPPINNQGPNAVFSVSPDGNTLLLMNTYTAKGNQKGMGLSISRKTSEGWSIPEDVKMRSFYNKSFYNEYFLSNDGKVILLAVNRDDTFGSRDLYISFAEDKSIWSAPRNLGKDINTSGTELSPFLAADGKTLYFSSNGHPGYGRNDVFMSRRLDESWTRWSKPINLGKPINSSGTDAYYSVSAAGDYAYYVSNEEGLGKNDIFRIFLPTPVKPEPVVLVYGKVRNSKTNAPLSTGITYHDFTKGNEIGIARSNPESGYYEIVLPISRVYSFFAEKQGYYSVQDRLDLLEVVGYQEIERDLLLTPIEKGQVIKMNNVLFHQSKAQLITTSYPELDKLTRMLVENPGITIELAGHTDNVGDRFKNLKLSQDRVGVVKEYLVKGGVEAQRITGVGYGGSKPIADNQKEITKQLNRRVEFKITGY